MSPAEVILIAAMDRNRVIGRQNTLPWKLSSDLKNFKKLTLGYPVLMGRKTYESIGRPLPGRTNLVLTRQISFQADGCRVVTSIEEALLEVTDKDRIFVIGGSEIYKQTLPYARRLFLTHVDTEIRDGDAFFPEWDPEEYHTVSQKDVLKDDKNEYNFSFAEYAKKNPVL